MRILAVSLGSSSAVRWGKRGDYAVGRVGLTIAFRAEGGIL